MSINAKNASAARVVGRPYLTLSKTANAARKSANAPQPILRKPASILLHPSPGRGATGTPVIVLTSGLLGRDYLAHNLIVV